MTKKRNTVSEPIVAGGAAPARARKHAPAKRKTTTAVENSPSTDINALALAVTASASPTFDEIARLAYSYWEARGCQGGSPDEDWLRAEQELMSRA